MLQFGFFSVNRKLVGDPPANPPRDQFGWTRQATQVHRHRFRGATPFGPTFRAALKMPARHLLEVLSPQDPDGDS